MEFVKTGIIAGVTALVGYIAGRTVGRTGFIPPDVWVPLTDWTQIPLENMGGLPTPNYSVSLPIGLPELPVQNLSSKTYYSKTDIMGNKSRIFAVVAFPCTTGLCLKIYSIDARR